MSKPAPPKGTGATSELVAHHVLTLDEVYDFLFPVGMKLAGVSDPGTIYNRGTWESLGTIDVGGETVNVWERIS